MEHLILAEDMSTGAFLVAALIVVVVVWILMK